MSEMQKQSKQDGPPGTALKSERVGEGLAAGGVDELLRRLPGWGLVRVQRTQALERVRELATPEGAADYAGFILREAARSAQKVRIGLSGHRIVVTVLGLVPRGVHAGITARQIEFAAALG
jgi:hypothetical protein